MIDGVDRDALRRDERIDGDQRQRELSDHRCGRADVHTHSCVLTKRLVEHITQRRRDGELVGSATLRDTAHADRVAVDPHAQATECRLDRDSARVECLRIERIVERDQDVGSRRAAGPVTALGFDHLQRRVGARAICECLRAQHRPFCRRGARADGDFDGCVAWKRTLRSEGQPTTLAGTAGQLTGQIVSREFGVGRQT